METINVTKSTKNEFDTTLIKLRIKERRNIFSDEFIGILLKKWEKDSGDTPKRPQHAN
tara:strand:- start:478 stop:651 length:174 start_codon:yes stop_codon:yes gene_type:complete